MHDLKLTHLGAIQPLPPCRPKSVACALALHKLKEHARPAINLAVIPGWSFVASLRWSDAMLAAMGEMGEDAMKREREGELQSRMKERLVSAADHGSDAEERLHIARATRQFARVVEYSGGEGIKESLCALMESIAIQAWTAFEVTVRVLLLEAIKAHPSRFPAGIKAENLQFLRREQFRKAYRECFPVSAKDVHDPLHHISVDALCLIRNVLAHCGGFVDPHFKEGCEKAGLVAWAEYPLSFRFQIDGEILERHVNEVLKAAVQLITAVDLAVSS